jgi:hypothetical protein
MKPKSIYLPLLLSAGMFLLSPLIAQAQAPAHYAPGCEGILGSTLPPPGLYLLDYNFFYTAGRANNDLGKNVAPSNFNVFAYANISRLVWISDTKFLGGYVGVDGLVPFIDQNVKDGAFNSSTFGLGDVFLEGTLSWHLPQFDFSLGAGAWMPTGDSAAPPTTRVGMGFWENMNTGGITWYPDKEKTWAVSALSRYEISGAQRDTNITPGEVYSLDWAVSKTFLKTMTAGPVGYYQQQVTTNSNVSGSRFHDRVAAVGGEFDAVIPWIDVRAALRYYYEFMAEDRAQGHTINLVLTKRF